MHLNRQKIRATNYRSSKKVKRKNRRTKETKIDIKKRVGQRGPVFPKKNEIRSSKNLSKKNNFNKFLYLNIKKWKGKLKNNVIFILGNGPSISKQPLHLLDDYFTIGVNRIFYIYDPIILFWQDINLWRSEREGIFRSKAIKVCRDFSDPQHYFMNFKLHFNPPKFMGITEELHGRGNSGMIAVQFAVALGCSSVVFLGMDCKYNGKKTDFYGVNKDHKPHTLDMCHDSMQWLQKKCPVKIYNCSKSKYWPKVELENVLKEIDTPKGNKEYFKSIFQKKKK